jgi:hypothetical protein
MVVVDSFIEPKEVVIGDRTFTVSKIPAIQAQRIYGKIIDVVQEKGDIGITALPLDVGAELLKYTAVHDANGKMPLDTNDKINSTFVNLFDLIELQTIMVKENFGFFFDGSLLKVLAEADNTAMKQ